MPKVINPEKYIFNVGDKVVVNKRTAYFGTVLEKVLFPNYPHKDSVCYNVAVNGQKQRVELVDENCIIPYDTFIFDKTMEMAYKINQLHERLDWQ